MRFERREVDGDDFVVVCSGVGLKQVVNGRGRGDGLRGQSNGTSIGGVEVGDVGRGEWEQRGCGADFGSR